MYTEDLQEKIFSYLMKHWLSELGLKSEKFIILNGIYY